MKRFSIEIFFASVFLLMNFNINAQGTLPIYSDYLSDNIYLVHPSAAGIGNNGKLRLTHRQQWIGVEDAPSLQTLSFNNRFGEKMALGAIVFNDKNGYHSQLGVQGTYAYHLNFGRDEALNQLSLALSASYVQNSNDQREFTKPDPVISQIIESNSYFNTDFSMAYHFMDGFAYFTIKNLLLNVQNAQIGDYRKVNSRRYLFNSGYFFGWGTHFQLEPSIMFQYVSGTEEKIVDLNAKVYKTFGHNKRGFFALSYRASLDNNGIQELSQVTPILGLEIDKFIVSYTYTHQIGAITFQEGGYHQFTFGVSLFNKRQKDRGYIPNYNPFMYKSDN
ncbi:type IX secretion system membrane protein PorP/SprF [Aureibaculum sp. A20]|uniref:Type IX secretion system membrane protein PorP/SprF n=1 Tax=Aureibaculum flavum TaxID=2795986 RepID=A0ABS0WUQ5_9FLAO|nr:type IX secretion system membrane protein PorP/SprF [Aureibaculum flavum]MBJ2175700.1 type IX secretion system membrane protein PorP/SprF [Aureibaculum flavum]